MDRDTIIDFIEMLIETSDRYNPDETLTVQRFKNILYDIQMRVERLTCEGG
jgi:hypothetical protein